MKSIDKIRAYIQTLCQSEQLLPGDRLPPYREIGDRTGVSYMTVKNVMLKLQQEGLVTIRGRSGTFVAGGNPLKICLTVVSSNVAIKDMRLLLNKHLANANLHLELDIKETSTLSDPTVQQQIQQDYKAAVSIVGTSDFQQTLPFTSIYDFPDYEEVMSSLAVPNHNKCVDALPFAFCTHLMGVNKSLLKKAGLTMQDLKSDFSWWEEYAKAATANGFKSASLHVTPNSPCRLIHSLQDILASLVPYDKKCYTASKPLFDTPGGHRFLEIIKDIYYYEDVMDPNCFEQNGAGLNFSVGSWISTQNNSPKFPEKAINDLAVLPFQSPSGRKFLRSGAWCLRSFMRHDMTTEERNRIWALMKIMVSRDFLLDYCGKSGLISFNKNILPTEYHWNRTNEWKAFFPKNIDKVALNNKIGIFHPFSSYVLSSILENYLFYGESLDIAAKRLDQKKAFS